MNCCGGDSFLDFRGMDFPSNESLLAVPAEIDGDRITVLVPGSCCARRTQEMCTHVRATGCRQAIANAIVQNASVLGVLGVSVMFILVSPSGCPLL